MIGADPDDAVVPLDDADALPETVTSSRPLVTYLYHYLASVDGGRSHGALRDVLGVSGAALRSALADLTDAGLVDEWPHPTDGRRRLYVAAASREGRRDRDGGMT